MSTLKRAALGQGLGALLPPSRNIDDGKADKEVPIGQLRKNRYQPRKTFDATAAFVGIQNRTEKKWVV